MSLFGAGAKKAGQGAKSLLRRLRTGADTGTPLDLSPDEILDEALMPIFRDVEFPKKVEQGGGRQQSFIDDKTAEWNEAADRVDGTSDDMLDNWYKSQLDYSDVHDPDVDLAKQIDNAQKLDISEAQKQGAQTKGDFLPEDAPPEVKQIVELGPEQELRGVEKLIYGITPDEADVKESADLVKKVFGSESRDNPMYTTDDQLYTPVEESLVMPDARYRTAAGGTTTEPIKGRPLPKNYDRSTFLSDPMGDRGVNKGQRAEIGIRLEKMMSDVEDVGEITPEDISNYLRVEFGDEYSTVQNQIMRQFLGTPMGKYWKEHIGQPGKALRFDTQFGEGKSKGKHVSVSPKLRKADKEKPEYKADRGPGSRGLDDAQKNYIDEVKEMNLSKLPKYEDEKTPF